MKKHVLMLTSCAFILASGAVGAGAEEGSDFRGRESHAMMGQEGGMGCRMMGRGMMHGGGMMGRGVAMRFIFALMDSDGDGTVSLQEFQAAQEKIFKAMDVEKMAPSPSKRFKPSCEGPVNRLRKSTEASRS